MKHALPGTEDDFALHVMQAYNDPGRMEGIAECSENGTQTVYMDRSFLLERVQGVLQVSMRFPPPL
jgi:hypothetical protein